MLQECFQNVLIIGSIISICLLPLLIYLSRFKNKYNVKRIYKIYFILSIILFLPILNIKVQINSSSKSPSFNVEPSKIAIDIEDTYSPEQSIDIKNTATSILDKNIEIKNDFIFKISSHLPYIWFGLMNSMLLYYIIIHFVYIYKLKLIHKTDTEIENIINKIKKEMNIKKRIHYAFSSNITTPMSIGIFKKQIIIPIKDIDYKDYSYILKHEIFHIKNKDIEYKFLLLLLNCIYWFNPIVYLLIRELNEAIELNCDDNILKKESSNYRLEYGNILLKQIEKNRNTKYKILTNFASTRRNIMNRFSNIVTENKKKTGLTISIILSIIVVVALLLIVFIPTFNIAAANTNQNNANNYENKETTSTKKTVEESTVTAITESKKVAVDTENKENLIANSSINTNTVASTNTNTVANTNTDTNSNTVTNANETTTTNSNSTENSKNLGISFIKPVDGIISRNFGYSSYYNSTHTGIDVIAPTGTSIKAAASGTVSSVTSSESGYGSCVIIQHSNSVQTLYAHCNEIYVSQGQTVNQGDTIATVGETGNATGPNLHFEIINNGTKVDPQNYVY